MLRASLLLLAWLVLPAAAGAASFPCAKAATATERAICAEPELSRLDERLAAAYREALRLLSGANPDGDAAGNAVRADQRAWLAERNACGGDPACLRVAYERRVAVLAFGPDPGAPTAAAERYAGHFEHGGFIGISALALRGGGLAVTVSGAEPGSARWVCHFSGLGRMDADGRLVVGTPNADGEGLVIERVGQSALRIGDGEANLAASAVNCGRNGSFAFTYSRRK